MAESHLMPDPLHSLLACWEQRVAFLSQPDPFSSRGHQEILQGLEEQILKCVVHVLDSRDAGQSAQLLRDQNAQYFLDVVQHVLRNASLPTPEYARRARRLMVKLAEASESFPNSLSIIGVTNRSEHPKFHGGFGDIFPASHQGKRVALKRLRIFTGDPTTSHRTRLRFYKEALIWEGLHHPFILPFLGIDSNTFPSLLCMVSPWMENGTVLDYLKDHGLREVDRLLIETAEGLRYLHSMNIVHGDLRGNNILISNDFNVCLADFGLANIISHTETTAAASSSNHAGSTRWFAPELIRPTAFGCDSFVRTPASDMYAFGCVCYEGGAPPFSDVTPDISALLKVMEGERPGKPTNISDALWALVTTVWEQDWRQRLSAADTVTLFPVSPAVQRSQDEQDHDEPSDGNIPVPMFDSDQHTVSSEPTQPPVSAYRASEQAAPYTRDAYYPAARAPQQPMYASGSGSGTHHPSYPVSSYPYAHSPRSPHSQPSAHAHAYGHAPSASSSTAPTRPRSHSPSYAQPQQPAQPYPPQVPIAQATGFSDYPQGRPFACDMCALSFTRQHDLKSHRETHTGEKRFLWKDALKRLQASPTSPNHRSFPAHGSSVVTCLILSEGRIISASDDHPIHVYDPIAGELRLALRGHEGGVWALAATRDMLVSGSTDRTVRIWDLVSGRCTHVFGGHTGTVRCLAIVHPKWVEMEDGQQEKWPKRSLIVTGSRDHTLRVWTLPRSGDAPYSCFDEGDPDDADDNPYHRLFLEGHDHAIRALDARGRTLVSGSFDCTVRVWDLVTGACRWVLTGHTQKVYSVVLDPTRHQAYSGSMDGTVRIWDLMTGRCAHTLTGHTSLVGLLGLSPRTLVSAAADSTLRVWDPDTGALLHTLAAHTGAITCFQHDDFKVLSGSDGILKMWNIRNGTVARDLLTGVTGVWQVVFKGRWCVAASNQTRNGAAQTVLDVWDFAEEREDWVGEPPGGVYDESDSGVSDDEDDDTNTGFGSARTRRSMDVEMGMIVEDDDEQEQADVDAMDQDLLVPTSDDGSGSELHRSRDSPVVIEVDEPVPTDDKPSGGNTSQWMPPPLSTSRSVANTGGKRALAQNAAAPSPSTASTSATASTSSSTWRRSSPVTGAAEETSYV